MKNKERPIEKRSHNRLQTKDGVYAVISYKPTVFGQITNISKDGMAVRYSSNGKRLSMPSELDIFIIDTNFYIEKIQIKIISDFEIGEQSHFSFQKNRQVCFQFKEMKSSQLFQLDYLLKNYTTKGFTNKDRTESNSRPI